MLIGFKGQRRILDSFHLFVKDCIDKVFGGIEIVATAQKIFSVLKIGLLQILERSQGLPAQFGHHLIGHSLKQFGVRRNFQGVEFDIGLRDPGTGFILGGLLGLDGFDLDVFSCAYIHNSER